MGDANRAITATITAAGGVSAYNTTAVNGVTATITATGIARVNTAIRSVTAAITAVGNSTHQSGASLTVSAQAGPAGYSTLLPATGLLWMHDGTTYRPRRAWMYDGTGTLKPVTFNRA